MIRNNLRIPIKSQFVLDFTKYFTLFKSKNNNFMNNKISGYFFATSLENKEQMNSFCLNNFNKKDLNVIVCKLTEIVIKNNFDDIKDNLNSIKGIINKHYFFEFLIKNKEKNQQIKIEQTLLRINIFFLACWILSHLISKEDKINFYRKNFLLIYLKYEILKQNKFKIMKYFSLVKDKRIQYELNRNFRIIFLCFKDFYNNQMPNIMMRSLIDILKE